MGAGLSYPSTLLDGTFLERRKRFFADVRLASGETIVSHCANTGSMRGLLEVGQRARVSFHDNPKRKLKYSLEQLEVDGSWVMVNTALPNRIVEAALLEGAVPELRGYAELRRERPYGERSRVDLELAGESDDLPVFHRGAPAEGVRTCLVEVKNVTLVEDRVASFPDAVSERATKHVRELAAVARAGGRAVMLLHVARDDVDAFTPADGIDPAYGAAVRTAVDAGVELLAWTCEVGVERVALKRRVPVRL